ncbi:MAG TPA: Tfp pilus assembly protein FimT/FimU [Steroidobacteraceae bacterium]|nr:Tfp pilus assembly protein FimT/FimU [Steroidobacteraceae bacterium]
MTILTPHFEPSPGSSRQCCAPVIAGFTLIEMLMTIAIAAILMGLAIPSFRYITNANRIASELNGLLGDLQLARAEAIKQGRNVTVCQSNDNTTCTNSTSWQSGWIVFTDPTNVGVHDIGEIYIRKQPAFSGADTFIASNNVSAITFNREGYAIGMANGTLLSLHDSSNNDAWTRCLLINLSGQMTSQIQGATINGVTCT